MEGIALPGLAVALLLPWLVGVAWARWLLRPSGRYNGAVLLGQGYFLGLFLLTLLIRLWDALGLRLDFWPIAGVFAGLGLLALVAQGRAGPTVREACAPARWTLWSRLGVTLLLLLIAWRYVTLTEELLLRPLFAWDAWMNWVPKAIVWFYQGELVEFVHPLKWQEQAGAQWYVLGNRQAWNYPPTVPLIQLWSMLGAGTWDGGALYLPWLLAPLCLALALYGHLRLAQRSPALAVTAAYILLSMPYINVHSVLAGYADIWLAAAFGLGVLALYEWRLGRHWSWALLAFAAAAFCSQLKIPGIFLGLVLLFGLLRTWLNLPPGREVLLLAAGLGVLAVAMALNLSLQLPYLGQFTLGFTHMEVGRLGRFALEYHPVGGVMLETFFDMINWHLLGYTLPPLILYLLLRRPPRGLPETEVLVTALAAAFVFSVFYFTGYYTQALNYVAVNRALMYPVPALVFICFLYLPESVSARKISRA